MKNSIITMTAILGMASAQAAVVFTSFASPVASTVASEATASVGTDLLQTSLTSHTFQANTNINNGTTGVYNANGGGNPAKTVAPGVAEFTLDLTASPLGYDISQIDSYTGWSDNRAGQAYTISFSTVAAPATFTQITPGGTGDNAVNVAADEQSLVTHVFDDSVVPTLLGTGVAVIRFDVGVNGANNVWREIDVIGTATIPEPSAFALFGFAGLGLIMRRRRA